MGTSGGDSVFSGAGRIVAVGDLHGNHDGLRRILQGAGLIDRRDRWCAWDTHLVQLGDVLGRGGEPGKIFRLLKRLEEEAPAFGSRVHLILGNHEAMTLSGMHLYNTEEELRDLAETNLLETAVAEKAATALAGASTAASAPLPASP
ncbi:MAG TPA: metallophosphoesterase, partial [Fibrobacteria bacterium]|nr:metallophosphoesterase [Fibrobacteria bacterium]